MTHAGSKAQQRGCEPYSLEYVLCNLAHLSTLHGQPVLPQQNPIDGVVVSKCRLVLISMDVILCTIQAKPLIMFQQFDDSPRRNSI